MGRRPRKNIIWSREAISIMGLGTSNMAKMAKSGVLSQNENFKVAQGGCARSKIFSSWNSVTSLLGGPICKKKYFWGPPLRPATLFCGKTSLAKNGRLRAIIAIKGRKFQKSGFSQDCKSMFQTTYGGYTRTKLFYNWNSVTLVLQGHIYKIMIFDDLCCALQHYSTVKRFPM